MTEHRPSDATRPRPYLLPPLLLVLVFVALLLARGRAWTGTGVDQCFYYGQLSTLLWDGDLELGNDLIESTNGLAASYDYTSFSLPFMGERVMVPFPTGPGMMATTLVEMGRRLGGPAAALDRYHYMPLLMYSATTWLLVLAGLLALQQILATRFGLRWGSLAIPLVVFLATNMSQYTWADPAMAHGASFGLTLLLLWATLRYFERPTWQRMALCALILGLATVVRWQSLCLGIFPGFALLARDPRRLVGHFFVLFLVSIAFFLPQMLYWHASTGKWVLAPQGGTFFILELNRFAFVLFSPLHGLVYTHPIWGVGLVLGLWGLVAGGRRSILMQARGALYQRLGIARALRVQPFTHDAAQPLPTRFLFCCWLAFAISWTVNSLPADWWGGGSFGARRFADSMGAVALLATAGWCVLPRPGRWAVAVLAMLLTVVNMLVQLRGQLEYYFPFQWSVFLSELPQVLSWLIDNPRVMLVSDFLDKPSGLLWSHGDFRMAFLAVLLLITVVGITVVLAAYTRRSARLAGAVAIGVASGQLAVWLVVLSMADWPHRGDSLTLRRFQIEAGYTLHGNVRDNRSLLDRVEAETGAFPFLRLEQLLLALRDREFDQADRLSVALYHYYPRSVAQSWQNFAAPGSPHRERWIERFLREGHADMVTLRSEFHERLLVGDRDRARALIPAMGGPARDRIAYRLNHELATIPEQDDVLRLTNDLLRQNPFSKFALLEQIRIETDPVRRQALLDRHQRGLDVVSSLSRWVRQRHPEITGSIGVTFWDARCDGMLLAAEAAGNDLEMHARWLDGTDQHMPTQTALYLWSRLKRLREYNRRLQGIDPAPPGPTHRSADVYIGISPREAWAEDGFGVLEPNEFVDFPYRWTTHHTTALRPAKPLPPGRYRLDIEGYSWPGEAFRRTMSAGLYGTDIQLSAESPGGSFTMEMPFELTEEIDRPTFWIHFPTRQVLEHDPTGRDTRLLGFLFSDATIHRLDPPDDPAPR